jgi:cardiolipin synthase
VFRPEVGRLSLRRNRLRRMHRKLAVIDAQIGFAGGINIIDDMHTPGTRHRAIDFAVRVRGPLVARMHAECQKLWERVAWATLQFRPRIPRLREYASRHAGQMRAGCWCATTCATATTSRTPTCRPSTARAREIIIANAYFLPGAAFARH